MAIDFNFLTVRIDLAALRRKYRVLAKAGTRLMPVVKADAYGHGLAPVAQALAAQGCDILAAGSVAETARLRDAGFAGRAVALLGPVLPDDHALLTARDVIPLVGRGEQLARLGEQAASLGRSLAVALKFDTGMSRLGFSPQDLPAVLDLLAVHPGLRVELAASHLAAADEEDKAAFVLEQTRIFQDICQALRAAGHRFDATLANSAGLLAHPDTHHHLQRPGIALYGANPFHGTAQEPLGRELTPVMAVSTPVLEVRLLEAGQCVGYGCTYRAPDPMRLAIVAAGYADGYSRQLSNVGAVCLHGRRAAIVGRVCMQMTAVDVTRIPEVRPGDDAWLLGGQGQGRVRPEDLAGWWGTIPYEVFCILGLNARSYVDEEGAPAASTSSPART